MLETLEHHGASPIHVSTLSAAAAAAAHHMHSSPQMAQVSTPQSIFISSNESRQAQIELLHRTARRTIAAPRRNYARIHWPAPPPPPPHHPHSHAHAHAAHTHRHTLQHQTMSHQPQLPIQTGIINSGILLNFL